ncbi:chromate efflux transporter [Flavobacterium chuncheonense]|uniref:Chromate efflux transporter n=1 Tax=Flavobacterium chuncheonense TaxID=2026653 RepID=A0ABW5YNV5_9FLAO
MTVKTSIKEIAQVFFKLGCFSFGGPAAHIAMMEEEVVNKRKWMEREHFLDLIGATNLIPGPNSTEMTMHCGYEKGGSLGLFVAGISFIVPAVLVTGCIAWLYTTYGQLPKVEPFLWGIKPAVLAIIVSAILKLGQKALKSTELTVLGCLALIACLLGFNEIYVLLFFGLAGALYFNYRNKKKSANVQSIIPLLFLQSSTTAIAQLTTSKIFWVFLKVGAVLYGGGYVLFGYLDGELVAKGLLNPQQLIDAVAVGQFTPGPVLSTATFIGYQLDGFWGALAATLGIFLPSFLFVLLLNPFVPKMRQSSFLSYFLDCVNVAAVAIMVNVLFNMSVATLIDWKAILITLMSLIITFALKKVNVMWTVIGGSILGYLLLLL